MAEEKKKKELVTEVLDDDFEDEDEDLDLDDLDEDEEIDDVDDDEDEKDKKDVKDKKGRDDDEDDDDDTKKEEQDKAERARQAKARREREAKEREAREKEIERKAYLKGKLDSTKVNEFTEEAIEDEYDLFIYETQKALKAEGKDPIADLPKRLAEINRKTAKEKSDKESEQKQLNEKIDKEFAEFRGKYPTIKLTELLSDPDFKDYADGRLGKGDKSLTQLYENFLKLKEKFGGKKGDDEDDGITSSPSSTGGRKTTKTSYSQMTEEQRIKELRRQGLIN